LRQFPFGWQRDFDPEDDDELLKKVLALPEAKRILEIYVASKFSTHSLCQLGRKLHAQEATLRGDFDQLILISSSPRPDSLGNYARFLKNIREDHDAAEAFYKRAIEADPKHASSLGNHGQFLLGRGDLAGGISLLRDSWRHRSKISGGNAAESAFCLWLGTWLDGTGETVWEGAFKHGITAGFQRHKWNFDAILAQASKHLKPADLKYARALAAAFLDESMVPALGAFPRWRKLQPIDPERVSPGGKLSG
jgi:hypothetical protein